MKKYGVEEIILAVTHLLEVIRGHFGDGKEFGIRIEYSVEEEPLGTGGAIKQAESFLDETFLVLNGDILTDMNLEEAIEFHRRNAAQVTIQLVWVEDPTPYGLVETDAKGRVLRFLEKPQPEQLTTNYINAGIYVFEPEILKEIPQGQVFSVERELFPYLVESQVPVFGHQASGYWLDLGTMAKYLQANQDILSGQIEATIPGKQVSEGVWLSPTSSEHSTAEFQPPVLVGTDCKIEPGCQIGPQVVIGDHVSLGRGAQVERSVIWDDTQVGRETRIINSVIGRHCMIKCGAKLTGEAVEDKRTVG